MDDEFIHSLLPAVAQQAASPDTPFVAPTLERLIEEDGIEEEEARYMIAFCLADEIERMNSTNTPFDLARYELLLKLLPTLPEGN
jgi:hypothetical protein